MNGDGVGVDEDDDTRLVGTESAHGKLSGRGVAALNRRTRRRLGAG